jgi:anti-sigma factor RsiW
MSHLEEARMSHLDEGTLHALLDGELEMSEVAEIQAHLGSCAACGSRLREVKQFLMEADRLVAEVQIDAHGRAPLEQPPRRDRQAAELPLREPPDAWEGAPVLLIPDNPDPGEFGRRWLKKLAWAAMLVVTVGAGYIAVQVRRGGAAPFLSDAGPVASTREPVAVQPSSSPAVAASDTGRATASPNKPGKPASPPPARAGAIQKTAAAAPESLARAKRNEAKAEESAGGRSDKLARVTQADESSQVAPAEAESKDNVVREAAQAMAELDRERVRQRAAAATAALDSTGRRRAQARPTQPTPVNTAAAESNEPPVTLIPAIRTPEQRAQIYLRIGLDEASRQLGSPVHVIEGMSPIFMGLAQGRVSTGADTARPVVRVVYQDSQGRLIFLDQQRTRSGQPAGAAPAGEPAWTLGETRLHLHGEVGPDLLQRIRPRVR